jgi:hypothetical protein
MMNGDTSLLALHPGRRTGGNLPQSRARFQPGRVLCTAKAAVRRRSRGSLVQCGPLFLLHVALRRCVPLRASSIPTGNIRQQKFLDIWNRSPQMQERALDSGQGSASLLLVFPRQQLHALSGARVFGGKANMLGQGLMRPRTTVPLIQIRRFSPRICTQVRGPERSRLRMGREARIDRTSSPCRVPIPLLRSTSPL